MSTTPKQQKTSKTRSPTSSSSSSDTPAVPSKVKSYHVLPILIPRPASFPSSQASPYAPTTTPPPSSSGAQQSRTERNADGQSHEKPRPVYHYTYVRAHQPKQPDPASHRSLFMGNIPVDTTETHLRCLLIDQLGGGRIEHIDFETPPGALLMRKSGKQGGLGAAAAALAGLTGGRSSVSARRSKKRKRALSDASADKEGVWDAEDGETLPKLAQLLPHTWDRYLLPPGSSAVIRFVDKPSMDLALAAISKHAKAAAATSNPTTVVTWRESSASAAAKTPKQKGSTAGAGATGAVAAPLPSLGSRRYAAHERLRYPAREDLQALVDEYMARLGAVEAAQTRDAQTRRNVPDADGFVTVTRGGGSRTGPARVEDARERLEAQQAKEQRKRQGMPDFYRFQVREARKKRAGELVDKFRRGADRLDQARRRRLHRQQEQGEHQGGGNQARPDS